MRSIRPRFGAWRPLASRRRVVITLGLAACITLLLVSVDAIRWRTELIALKAGGQLPDLSWQEIVSLLPPSSGVWLKPVVASRNPYASLVNRRTSPDDIRTGGELFHAQCAACHGSEGEGGTAPSLVEGRFRNGTTDWAIFKTIREGVPGTAMRERRISPTSVWQLVAFVKNTIATAGLRQVGTRASQPKMALADVAFERLIGAAHDSREWLMYSGAYNGQRHSHLTQIRRDNIAQLGLKWLFQLPTDLRVVENTPLVVGNVMFVSLPPGDVWALDARTGETLWTYTGPPPAEGLRLANDAVNRGVAILGHTLYVGRIDAYLVALDANTGTELWRVQVADSGEGYSMTSPPLALQNAIVVGVAGGEFGSRGFVDAYSPRDGRRIWRFYTVPGPGELGHDTWGGDSWKRGGAPTWLTGSYDPDVNLVYWGVGNPSPEFQGDGRPGDNLFSNSVVALDAETGRLRWHHQFSPHDEHDWDSTQIPVLADASFGGQPRKLMYWANRNGFYYVLDRITGAFLHATPFVRQTWAQGIDAKGRPIEIPAGRPTREGSVVYPSLYGGTNWWSPSYDPGSNTFFVPATEGSSVFTKSTELTSPDGITFGSSARPAPGALWQAVRALDATTGALRWEHRFVGRSRMGGLLSTAGGLVFASDDTRFLALDSANGLELWHLNAGDTINAAPITYLCEGEQQVTIAAGRAILTFSLAGR